MMEYLNSIVRHITKEKYRVIADKIGWGAHCSWGKESSEKIFWEK